MGEILDLPSQQILLRHRTCKTSERTILFLRTHLWLMHRFGDLSLHVKDHLLRRSQHIQTISHDYRLLLSKFRRSLSNSIFIIYTIEGRIAQINHTSRKAIKTFSIRSGTEQVRASSILDKDIQNLEIEFVLMGQCGPTTLSQAQ